MASSAAASSSPRRVFCVYEHRYQDRSIADGVVRGRFTIQGQTLDLGVEPDWRGDAALPADKEWRLEWSKFYYGLDLAAAAADSGDPTFARAWQHLVSSWIAQMPIDADPTDVIGRRIQNWVYAWSRFAERFDLDALEPGFTTAIMSSLRQQLAYLDAHLTRERNHRTLELYALFIAALALPDLDQNGRLLRFAVEALNENLHADVLSDGVQRERSTHYHHVVLRSFLGMRENARRFGLSVPDGFDERLARACEFAMHCQRPDGTIPPLSDSDSGSYLDLLVLAGHLLRRSDFAYVGTQGGDGTPPRARSVSFPRGGYFVQRSGWGDRGDALRDERFLIFDCGPLGDGGHGHYDALNIEVAAFGRPLVVDPGRFTYCDAPPHWRQWFKGTAAHNTVTIDGADQTPYRRGKPKGPIASARLLHRATSEHLDLIAGEVESPLYAAVHTRRILFVCGEYWLIEDRMASLESHRYQLRFHLAAEALGRCLVYQSRAGGMLIGPGMALVGSSDAVIALEEGWISEQYGIKLAAPVVTFTANDADDFAFLTLVAPLPPHRSDIPRLVVEHSGSDRVIQVEHGAVCDHITWSIDDDAVSWRRWSIHGALLGAASVAPTANRTCQ